MSLLDDARKLAEIDPFMNFWSHSGMDYWCYACDANQGTPHKADCSWLSLLKIVAALEAVYGLMQSEDGAEPIEDDVWAFCQRPVDGPHWDGCLWVRLRDLVYRDSAP